MSATSPLSTYLDITRANGESRSESDAQSNVPRILAALKTANEELLTSELAERTGLSTTKVFEALAWASERGLVELRPESDGRVFARLTPQAAAALSSVN
jgi:DNA-binding GntR family transcriptional regulator